MLFCILILQHKRYHLANMIQSDVYRFYLLLWCNLIILATNLICCNVSQDHAIWTQIILLAIQFCYSTARKQICKLFAETMSSFLEVRNFTDVIVTTKWKLAKIVLVKSYWNVNSVWYFSMSMFARNIVKLFYQVSKLITADAQMCNWNPYM